MPDIIQNEPRTVREKTLLEEVVLIDGQPGCGKTLFTAIVAAMDRVELLNYSAELENICALKYLNKITDDAAEAMIRIQMDLVIYETMMSRRTNFRPSDLSSVFRDVNILTYFKRLFLKGDEVIPERIIKDRPILHFATHNLLAFSKPIFDALKRRIFLIEIVRHPLYMLIQQTFNQINLYETTGTARQFHIFIDHNGKQLPYWNLGHEEVYLKSNPIERAIFEMKKICDLTEAFKIKNNHQYAGKILTIPFERFVLDPWPYMGKIEKLVDSKVTKRTKRIIQKQKVPRKKISEGIPLAIYKRCGWEPPDTSLSEKQELDKRRQFAVDNGAGKNALDVLDKLSEEYENEYFSFEGL